AAPGATPPAWQPGGAAAELPATAPSDRFVGRPAISKQTAEPALAPVPAPLPASAVPESSAAGNSGPRLELLAPVDTEQLALENVALKGEVGRLTESVVTLGEQLDDS